MSAETKTFHVALHGRRSVSRDIEIESASSLHDLAEAITGAFDFELDHPFGFYSGTKPDTMYKQQPKYELFADMGQETDAKSVKKTRIADVFKGTRRSMIFLFDYGDQWLFDVEMIGTGKKDPKLRYPRLTKSKGTAPEQYPDPDDDDF